jgi:BA14K-like protein
MKAVASLLAGTVLAVTMLLGGVVVASAILIPQEDMPRFTGLDVAKLWTLNPVRVDPTQQTYERLPPRYGSQVVMASAQSTPEAPVQQEVTSGVKNLDIVETGAVADGSLDQDDVMLSEAHMSWCHARYRSYRPDDNSYISYRGDMLSCVSPHLVDPAENGGESPEAMLVQDIGDTPTMPVAMNSAHAQNCLQRYRSYRPQDNSYQPYGGGPRRQCELRSF